jgi:RNA polymerase sigma factor (sigma-70 family)
VTALASAFTALAPAAAIPVTRMTEGALSDKEQDRLLVERARTGDAAAFDALVVKHSPRLYNTIYNMTSNREDAADLLQDTFALAYRSLPRFRGESGFHTWVHAIAVNAALNFIQRRKKRRTTSLEDMNGAIQHDPDYRELASNSDPVREAGLNELQERLNEAIQQLPPAQRAVVVMFDIQDMPHAEIGRIMGVSEGTVRSRLFYAHRQLQAILSDYLK